MRLLAAVTSSILFFALPSAAKDPMVVANELADVIGSEKWCGLTYDQAAIESFISANVPEDAMGFTSMLQLMIDGGTSEREGMSPSQKTAHCTQIKRVAKHYNFTK